MTSAVDNRRLAKNTMVLYFRMLFQMAVFFYTSRVIIRVLGVVDYGVYDVVAGLVVVMMFLNNAMTTSSQRFITVALGKGDKQQLSEVYSNCIIIHGLMALVVLLLGETVGLWYMHNYMNIPPERFDSALWVFHCSLLSAMFLVFNVPFNAAIIAYERMTAFAFISIFDILCKLGIVLALPYCNWGDKLQIYAVMLLAENLVARSLYIYYCRRNFPDLKFTWKRNAALFRSILCFAGWNSFSNTSVVCNTQGLNLLLNYMGGPAVNAARGIAFSVQSAVTAFISSFQTAINPQITKSCAQQEFTAMQQLVMRSSRLSFCIVLLLFVPLICKTEWFLWLWLGSVPDYAVTFTRLLLCVSLVDALANPLMVGAAATGRVKRYYIIEGCSLLSILPIACAAASLGCAPQTVFAIQLTVVVIVQIIRIKLCNGLFGLPIKDYLAGVMLRCLGVLAAAYALPRLALSFLPDTTASTLGIIALSIAWTTAIVLAFGTDKAERTFIFQKISSKCLRSSTK